MKYAFLLCTLFFAASAIAAPQVSLTVEEVHPWRPPFGVERVGQSRVVAVEVKGNEAVADVNLAALLGGKEVARRQVQFPASGPRVTRVSFDDVFNFDEIVLSAAGTEIARQKVQLPAFEADAAAKPEQVINPVDLGAILVPTDWLLLGPGQNGKLTVRAIERGTAKQDATVKTWFESAPDKSASAPLALTDGSRVESKLDLPAGASAERDAVHVAIVDSAGKPLWEKSIKTMRVSKPPQLPKFGAVEMKLRYDAPISLRDPKTGKYSSIPYDGAWDPKLNDVVVALPNGSRYVFWRGSCYIPFWAGQHNTGLSYEWAERTSGAPGVVDCIEPLMDKELRYGRVEIVESTAARIHIRWTYQSTDLIYQVWGDQAVEDYYFYPDSYGTRVLNLKRDPAARYEVSEFIIITPQETYPLDVLRPDAMDLLFVDGQKVQVKFPWKSSDPPATLGPARPMQAMYRVRINKDDQASPIYFNPRDIKQPNGIFGHFEDRGQLVTPAYWGSHWPLARGNMTGSAIDDRVHLTPCHNSMMTWGTTVPDPVFSRTGPTIDAQGHARVMTTEEWTWLIGLNADSDERLLQWANSFSHPPTIEATGAHASFDGYVDATRATKLIAEGDRTIKLKLTPAAVPCVNPVIEIESAPQKLKIVKLAEAPLDPSHYAWDGKVLWLDQTFDKPIQLTMEFE